jgi:hypothetical protein
MAIEPDKDKELGPMEELKPLGIQEFHASMKAEGRVVLPYVKLVQAMSDDFAKEQVQPGNFRNTLSGEVIGPMMEVIPIGIFHWRRRFIDREVLCSSNDAIIGHGDPGGECRACPLSKWILKDPSFGEMTVDAGFQNLPRLQQGQELLPPPCTEQYVFPSVIATGEWKMPGALVLSKTAFQEGINFGFMIANAPYDTVYKVSANQINNARGTWWIPKVTLSRKASPDELAMVFKLRHSLRESRFDVGGDTPEPSDA